MPPGDVPPQIIFRYPIVNADGKILVPACLWRERKTDPYTPWAPSDGSHYQEINAPASRTKVMRVYFDPSLVGGNPIVTSADPELPPLSPRIEIGQSLNRTFQTRHPLVGGRSGNGIVRNQFEEGNDPDNAGLVTSTATLVDITDPELTTLGFTRGVQGAVDGYAAYGGELKSRTVGDERVFGRVLVKSSMPGVFDLPKLWFIVGEELQSTKTHLVLEKVISGTHRIYRINRKITVAGATGFMLGVQPQTSGVQFTVCGAQFAIQRNGPIGWVGRRDFSTEAEQLLPKPLMGGDLWAVQGREPDFYWENVLAFDDPGMSFVGTISFPRTAAQRPYVVSGDRRGGVPLDASRIADGSTADLRMFCGARNYSYPYQQLVRCHVAPATVTGSPLILPHWDSFGNRSALAMWDEKMRAIGLDPTFLGTVPSSGNLDDPDDDTGPPGECREGRGWAELVNISTTRPNRPMPLPPGGEAIYWGNGKAHKEGYNAQLFPAADYPPGTVSFNGQVYDFGRYLKRFAPHVIPVPTHAPCFFGFNEASYFPEADIRSNIAAAVPIYCDSVLAVDDRIEIGIGMGRPGFSRYAFDLRRRWSVAIEALIEAVTRYNHPTVRIVPLWVHMDPYADYAVRSVPAADTASSVPWRRASFEDFPLGTARHPRGTPLSQMMEVATAWVANTIQAARSARSERPTTP